MSRRVVFHPLAELELNEAAQYYERESSGLGVAFVVAVGRCTQTILERPEAGTPLTGLVRRRLVGTFPYGVLYRVTAEEIRVLAIMNLKRRPSYWARRQ